MGGNPEDFAQNPIKYEKEKALLEVGRFDVNQTALKLINFEKMFY